MIYCSYYSTITTSTIIMMLALHSSRVKCKSFFIDAKRTYQVNCGNFDAAAAAAARKMD
jgi:hypothetical protein